MFRPAATARPSGPLARRALVTALAATALIFGLFVLPAASATVHAGARQAVQSGQHSVKHHRRRPPPPPPYVASRVNAIGEFLARSSVNGFGLLPQPRVFYSLDRTLTARCTARTLGTVTQSILLSQRFAALDYTPPEAVVALFRTALGRDPSAAEYQATLKALVTNTWRSVVDRLIASAGYAGLARFICHSGVPNYHPETTPPVAYAGQLAESRLQQTLDVAPSGTTVAIPPAMLVLLTRTLKVPSGVTLTTAGLPPVYAYLRMARFARAKGFNGPLIRLLPGAALSRVWVDGERMRFRSSDPHGFYAAWNVQTRPGPESTSITSIRTDNPTGPQNIRLGASASVECTGSSVMDSVVVNSSNDQKHGGNEISRADGIFSQCEHGYVAHNQILDPSDTAVIVFHSASRRAQATQVLYNDALLAGNDGPAVLDADEFDRVDPGCGPIYCNFAGTLVAHNVLWSGPCVRDLFGLAVGTREFSRDLQPWPPRNGRGASFIDNSTGAGSLRVAVEIYVSGMYGARVTGNFEHSDIHLVLHPHCARFDRRYHGRTVFLGHGSGVLQRHVKLPGKGLDGCIPG